MVLSEWWRVHCIYQSDAVPECSAGNPRSGTNRLPVYTRGCPGYSYSAADSQSCCSVYVPRSGLFSYYYGQAKKVYDSGKYEQSIPLFEKSLFATPNNLVARYYYVLALSKAKPTYSIQKKLYARWC